MDKYACRLVMLSILASAAVIAASQERSHAQDAKPTVEPAWRELMASMEKMHVAMASASPSGTSDGDFVRLMVPHHQAAIDMAKTELLYGRDPQMRRLAQEIVTDQQSEMELMQLWVKQNRPDSEKADQKPPSDRNKER
jgi:uncharacterized protein (DUF305 family)